MREVSPEPSPSGFTDVEMGGPKGEWGGPKGEWGENGDMSPADVKKTALNAAAAASADQLAEIQRDIAELEAQVEKTSGKGRSLLQPAFGLGAGVLGVLVLYLTFGALQEWIIKLQFKNSGGWFVSLVQFMLYTLFSIGQNSSKPRAKRKAPFSYYLILGFLQVLCMGLANVAVQYLNYPTHILFKSATPIPSLLFGAFYQKKRYGVIDYISTLAMLAGMAIFVIQDAETLPAYLFNIHGFLLVSIALLAEVAISPVQDKIQSKFKAPPEELILYTHLVGTAYLLPLSLFSGDLLRGLALSLSSPLLFFAIVIFSASGFWGAQVRSTLNLVYGGLAALLTSSFRKAFAVLLSVILFPKPFNSHYLLGLGCFLLGTLLAAQATKIRLRTLLGSSLLAKLLQLEPRKRAVNQILR